MQKLIPIPEDLEAYHFSIHRLIERTKKEDGELVFSKNGKIVRVKARDLKTDN